MPKKKLLYADDEIINRKLFSMLLMDYENLELIFVSSGEEAWKHYQEEKPDIVILDLYMPGMNGIQVMMNIRKLDKKIPVIAITGADFEDEGDDIKDLSFTAIYHKPINEDKIKEIINKYCGLKV
jgi:CheY-like chemotaxis protein